MRVLITTQIVDSEDPNLGFFARWIEEFAARVESVHVICLKEGRHNLPSNVTVHSLGKEKYGNRLSYIRRFYTYAWSLRNEYDAIFVHMNPEYVVLAGLWWRLSGKRIGLWYVHRSTPWYLRLAIPFVHVIYTASRESFRVPTKKLRIVGHGIDTAAYAKVQRRTVSPIRIVTIGRIAPAKRIAEMIAASENLTVPHEFNVYGAPATETDTTYSETLSRMVVGSDRIHFMGAIHHTDVPKALDDASVFLNLSKTESVDKAVLEALAAGIPVITSNPSFKQLLSPVSLFIQNVEPKTIASAIESAAHVDMSGIQNAVIRSYSLSRLIPVILETLAHG